MNISNSEGTMEDSMQHDESDEAPNTMQIIRVVQEDELSDPDHVKSSSKSTKNEEAEACSRQGYENLLRDLLTCLAKKYRIEEPCGSSQVKHEIWRQLTTEYLQLTGGLVNVSQKEVMRKWTNMKFNSKAKGTPHPLMKAETLDIKEIERKLKLCQKFVIGDDAIKRAENNRRYEAIKDQAKLKVQREAMADRECTKPTIKKIERQILTETLKHEQEKINILRENSRIEREKLEKDIQLADLEIQKAKFELEWLKRRRLM